MTYKEKHKLRLVAGTAVLAGTLLFAGSCKENNKIQQNKQKESSGLLYSGKEIINDKYDSKVEVENVDILVYNRDGSIKKGYTVLTKGNTKSKYTPVSGNINIQKAYINDNPKATYIAVREDYSVVTSNGFSGLFWDRKTQNVVLVEDKNINNFIADNESLFNIHSSGQRNRKNHSEEPEIAKKTVDIDNNLEIKNDSLHKDSSIVMPVDTNTYNAKQFVDTIRAIKQIKANEI